MFAAKIHPADQGGCRHYRLAEPARVLEGQVECVLDSRIPIEANMRGDLRLVPVEADVLVFQRPCKKGILERIVEYQKLGYAVVVDVDDDMEALPYGHPAHAHFVHGDEVNVKNLAKACSIADMVTCTTPALAERYGSHGRVAVLPNCVGESMVRMPREKDYPPTVGWAGAVWYHPDDLQATHGGVAEAAETEGWKFQLIGGDADEVQKRLHLKDLPQSTDWLTVEEYQRELGRLSIGVVPLADSVFNHAKSWLKGLEYAARGVPFIASPVTEYLKLAEEGIGIIAAPRSRNWRSAVKSLMMDESLRWEMAEQGCQKVCESHTYEVNGWKWAEAWEQAIRNRKKVVSSRPKARVAQVANPGPIHQPAITEPKVTVIMTVYEAAEHLQQAIDSVLGQTHQDLELCIMEDNSSDPRVGEILDAVDDPRVTIVRLPTTPEERKSSCRYARNINHGALLTKAPYITYLCSDDFFEPDRLERMLALLREGNEVVYGTQRILDEDGATRGTRLASHPLPDAFEMVDLNSVMHTRLAFAHVGGWRDDPAVWQNADAYFWRRLNDAGYVFQPVPGGPTDCKRYRRDSVDSRVTEGHTPWLERAGV